MSLDSTERYLGEYRLIDLVALKPPARRWRAEQTSIGRLVLIDELPDPDPAQRAEFLANIKVKAAVDHPLVASVYEAVSAESTCFYAHEILPGVSLADRLAANAPLRPIELAQILRRLAEAHIHMQQAGIASTITELRHIHLDDQGIIRLENLAVHGPRDPGQSARDIASLGHDLVPLVADAQPGATRALTLLGWMRGSDQKPPLEWDQVREVALQIEQQLSQPQTPSSLATSSLPTPTRHPAWAYIIGILAVPVIGLAIYAALKPSKNTKPQSTKPLATILIPAGRHPLPDDLTKVIPAFRIAAHEVTIREYEEFLRALDNLAKYQREKTYDHKEQPVDKKNHLPDDWNNLYQAALTESLWNTRPVSLDTPVVGVDWWDAWAYAEWRKARLPTQEEWYAALHHQCPEPARLPPSGWVAVSSSSHDRTPAGILGMAGAVAEWTAVPAINPSNPLGARQWVIMGGSFLVPGSNALTRAWVDDRSLRRADLGFRLVFDPEHNTAAKSKGE